ncbi:MAG TPA: YVTN family beta-propeller repeat-containing protein, partial [Candidatus Edwardsbacteria bacterium]|nr:YVTN family beta-propeller repeat-containing protein [Candidatus Edwardsbacteria bacterium]
MKQGLFVTIVATFMITVAAKGDWITNWMHTGEYPQAIAINVQTNKIYTANWWNDNVTVIDGATDSTLTVAAGSYPFTLAVNPVTNKIYVANHGSNNVTVIDGFTND